MMDVNRNQWFMAGLVLLFLGIQFRLVDSVVLTSECTQLLAEATGKSAKAADTSSPILQAFQRSAPVKKTVTPPDWLGWVLLSVGLVISLQSLAMKKPGQ